MVLHQSTFQLFLACNAVIKIQSKQPESQSSYVFHANEAVCKKIMRYYHEKWLAYHWHESHPYPENAYGRQLKESKLKLFPVKLTLVKIFSSQTNYLFYFFKYNLLVVLFNYKGVKIA